MLYSDILQSIKEGNNLTGHIEAIREELTTHPKSIVVLDDDPTGTQTVCNVPVITEWSEKALERELKESPLFFILTNSRSLQVNSANELAKLIGSRLNKLAVKLEKNIIVISRSDSTLRGHYPNEVNALTEGLGWPKVKHILAPAFFQGGRFTFQDIHYVQEADNFIPASETPFAKDNTFGYTSSNLKDWIIEKSDNQIHMDDIKSISIKLLREQSITGINTILEQPKTSHIVVNATSDSDLQTMALACLQYKGRLIFRTGASFVNAISGIETKACLKKSEVLGKYTTGGALTVIGSYVPKSTQQFNYLQEHSKAVFLEFKVKYVLDKKILQEHVSTLAKQIDLYIGAGKDVILYTSRTLIKGKSKSDSLSIVNKVSNGIISVVQKLSKRPKYILAKGGITSSDVATKGLSVKRAQVLGQVLKGVPVWQLDNESKFPNMPYIVFPGNVGNKSAIHELMTLLK